jgi:DNA primase
MKRAAEVMLRRGFDIKVAELPDGNDPADIISKDPAAFKKVVGNGVHVIEFLLHVLRRQYADDRTYKLKARDEVLPFVLLLPSRIDQEHFVGVVATALHTTTESVRFEVERLRERGVPGVSSSPSESTVTAESAINTVATEQLVALASYVAGAIPATAAAYQRALQVEFTRISALVPVAPEPIPALMARATFEVEEAAGQQSVTQVLETVVAALNRYRKLLIQHELGRLRVQLREAEVGGDESRVTGILADIARYGGIQHESAYTSEYFIAQKD